jgi:hypothetical protein
MRPLGVTLSAYFQFLRAVLLALFAAGVGFVSTMASRVASLAAEGNFLERALSGLGHFLAIALLIYAFIQAVLGVGLLLRQNWARLLTIIFNALAVLVLLPRALHLRPFSVLFAILNIAVLLYLLLPQAKAYFARTDAALAKTP